MSDQIQFSFDAPEISDDGEHVTWNWTVTNRSTTPGDDVTLTATLNPDNLTFTSATGDTTITTNRAKTLLGTLLADLPADLEGSVQISGRITWQGSTQAAAPVPVAPDARVPPPARAGRPAGPIFPGASELMADMVISSRCEDETYFHS